MAGLHPDPIVPLVSGARFHLRVGYALPVLLTMRTTESAALLEASVTVSCETTPISAPVAIQLQAKVWNINVPDVPTMLTHSNVWIDPVQKLMASALGPQAKLWTEWELSQGFLRRIYASRATDFMQPCTDMVLTNAPINTSCFEAALDFAHAHSPWGKEQFVSVPGTWLGGNFGDAISWQGIPIFDIENDVL